MIQDSRISHSDIFITNITDTSATIVWQSDEAYNGEIYYREGEDGWPVIFAQLGANSAYDSRDVGERYSRRTHHVKLEGLSPDTSYSFRIGGSINGKLPDINTFTTLPLQEELNTPDPAYGRVEIIDASDSVILFAPKQANENINGYFSTTIAENSTYSIDFNFIPEPERLPSNLVAFIMNAGEPIEAVELTGDGYKPLDKIIVSPNNSEDSQSLVDLSNQSFSSEKLNSNLITSTLAEEQCSIFANSSTFPKPLGGRCALGSLAGNFDGCDNQVGNTGPNNRQCATCNFGGVNVNVCLGANENCADIQQVTCGDGRTIQVAEIDATEEDTSGEVSPAAEIFQSDTTCELASCNHNGRDVCGPGYTCRDSDAANPGNNVVWCESDSASTRGICRYITGNSRCGRSARGYWCADQYLQPAFDAASVEEESDDEDDTANATTGAEDTTQEGGPLSFGGQMQECRQEILDVQTKQSLAEDIVRGLFLNIDQANYNICYQEESTDIFNYFAYCRHNYSVAPAITTNDTGSDCPPAEEVNYTRDMTLEDAGLYYVEFAYEDGVNDLQTLLESFASSGTDDTISCFDTTDNVTTFAEISGDPIGSLNQRRYFLRAMPDDKVPESILVYFTDEETCRDLVGIEDEPEDDLVAVNQIFYYIYDVIDEDRRIIPFGNFRDGNASCNSLSAQVVEELESEDIFFPSSSGNFTEFKRQELPEELPGELEEFNDLGADSYFIFFPFQDECDTHLDSTRADVSLPREDPEEEETVSDTYYYFNYREQDDSTSLSNGELWDFTSGNCVSSTESGEGQRIADEGGRRTLEITWEGSREGDRLYTERFNSEERCNTTLDRFQSSNTSNFYEIDTNTARLTELVPNLVAQMPDSTGLIEVDTSGRYAFFQDGARIAEKDIVVDGDSVRVRLFNDLNGNNIKDDDEPLLDSDTPIGFAREATVETYRLNAGWNLVSFPLIDTRENGNTTAADLINHWNSQRANILHVARYEGGRFDMYTGREGNSDFSGNFNIIPGQSYFVFNFANNREVSFSGNEITEPISIDLNQGWNLVGIISPNTDYNTESLLANISDQGISADTISQFENGTYTSVISDDGLIFGNNFNIIDTRGYFIRVEAGGGQEFTP